MTDVTTMTDRWFDADEVGVRLNVSGRTIRRLAQRGELAHYRVGGQVRIPLADLERYLDRNRVTARTL